MKEISSLATFAVGVVCFVMFLTTVKPDAPIEIRAAGVSGHCRTNTTGTNGCGLHLFAAISEAVVRRP